MLKDSATLTDDFQKFTAKSSNPGNLFLPASKTLAVGMYGMFGDAVQGGMFGMFAAGTLITAVPTVVLTIVIQRHIVSGLAAGSVKG